jgi:site-specific recombinase XerC
MCHEYASRLIERGVPLAQVRDLLGRASITTTERYDNQMLEALQAAGLVGKGQDLRQKALWRGGVSRFSQDRPSEAMFRQARG